MAEEHGGTPVVLNKEWMKKFIDEDVQEFQSAIEKINKDAPIDMGQLLLGVFTMHPAPSNTVQSVSNMVGTRPDNIDADMAWPLVLGPMVAEGGVGADLSKAVTDMAEKLSGVVEDQRKLFDDIESNLRDSMESLLKTEGDSLDKIDGEKLLDIFDDVSDDLADSMGSGGSGGDDEE